MMKRATAAPARAVDAEDAAESAAPGPPRPRDGNGQRRPETDAAERKTRKRTRLNRRLRQPARRWNRAALVAEAAVVDAAAAVARAAAVTPKLRSWPTSSRRTSSGSCWPARICNEENEIIIAKSLEGTKKKKRANKPNEFITNDDFCPNCGLRLKNLSEEDNNF